MAVRRPSLFKSKVLWSLVLAVLIGGAGYSLWHPAPPPPPPKPKPQAEASPKSLMETLSLTEIELGQKRWVMDADKAQHSKERGEIHLDGVHIDFFEDDGTVTHVKSQKGVVYTKTRTLTLTGQVEVTRGDLMAKAESASYDPKLRILVSHGNVVLEGPTVKVEGQGLTIYLNKHRLILRDHRRTEVKVAGKRLTW